MWFGGGWKGCDRTRIRVHVDGETNASIDMELYLGDGIGFGDEFSPWGVARIGKIGTGTSVYNTYRIPFGKSNRVTGQLGPDTPGSPQFWWIIRGMENLRVELGGVRLPEARYTTYVWLYQWGLLPVWVVASKSKIIHALLAHAIATKEKISLRRNSHFSLHFVPHGAIPRSHFCGSQSLRQRTASLVSAAGG